MTVASTKNTARRCRLRDKPRALDLLQPECRSTAGPATDEPVVLDDLPERIPVTGPELDVIETYVRNLIDRLLMDAASDRAVTPSRPTQGCPSTPPALDRD